MTATDPPVASATDSFRFPVDETTVLLSARSLGDTHPDYVAGTALPPTFLQAAAHFEPDYPYDDTRPGWRQKVTPRYPGAGKTLHGEQRFTYHHPVHVGDELVVTIGIGRQWEKQSGRGGTLGFVEQITEYRNQDGVLCVTAVNVGVIPENKPGGDHE